MIENRNTRPMQVTTAVVVFCIVLVVGTTSGLWHIVHNPAISKLSGVMVYAKYIAYGAIVGGFVLNALFIYKIFRGRNWARIIYLVFFILGWLFSIPGLSLAFHKPTLSLILVACGFVAQIIALILVFKEPGSTWFKTQVA